MWPYQSTVLSTLRLHHGPHFIEEVADFDHLCNRFLLYMKLVISLATCSNSVILLSREFCDPPLFVSMPALALGRKVNWDISGKSNAQIVIL